MSARDFTVQLGERGWHRRAFSMQEADAQLIEALRVRCAIQPGSSSASKHLAVMSPSRMSTNGKPALFGRVKTLSFTIQTFTVFDGKSL
ncbi:MAG: hypothetical protein QM661_15660, partial [Solimonas sp.]